MIRNKNILLIAPNFFGYETEIKSELSKLGAIVHFLPDRPFNSSIMKSLIRFQRKPMEPLLNHLIMGELFSLSNIEFDYIFVIQGEALTPVSLSKARKLFPSSKFILYIWDSIKNKKYLLKNIGFFHSVFTFDRRDAEYYSIKYLPLFFINNNEKSSDLEPNIDLSFIGTIHSNRYEILNKIKNELSGKHNYFFYLYLQAKWVYWYYRIFNPAFSHTKQSDFSFLPLERQAANRIFKHSKIILDIEHPDQSGLTIRTLEALGADKKLITTNTNIIYADFYLPENILIIDRQKKFLLDDSFLKSPYKNIDPLIKNSYTLNNWLKKIFSYQNIIQR